MELPDPSSLTLVVVQNGPVLSPHLSRLNHLSVDVQYPSDITEALQVVHSHIPTLEVLHLLHRNRPYGTEIISLDNVPSWKDSDLPHLHTLTIPGLCFTRGIAVASLRTLVLSDGPQSHRIFLSALDRCSLTLESLTLQRWAHPDRATNVPASATRIVPLPNLRRLKIWFSDEPLNSSPPTLLFAGLSLPPCVAIDIDWRCNPEKTRELLLKHLSNLPFDSVSLHLSAHPQQASVHCYVGGTKQLCVCAWPSLGPLAQTRRSFIAKFLDDHRYPSATQLAVDFDVLWLDRLAPGDVLRQFVAAFPNLGRLDLRGKTSERAKLAMAKAFLDLPNTSHPFKTLGYVCEVSQRHKAENPIGFVDALRAQLDALEALLETHLRAPRSMPGEAGSSRLHRLELCVAYTTLDRYPPPEAYPYTYSASASTELTAYVSSTYLPRFRRLVDEVVFVGDVKRRGPSGYRILTTGAARQPARGPEAEVVPTGPKRPPVPVIRGGAASRGRSVRMRGR